MMAKACLRFKFEREQVLNGLEDSKRDLVEKLYNSINELLELRVYAPFMIFQVTAVTLLILYLVLIRISEKIFYKFVCLFGPYNVNTGEKAGVFLAVAIVVIGLIAAIFYKILNRKKEKILEAEIKSFSEVSDGCAMLMRIAEKDSTICGRIAAKALK